MFIIFRFGGHHPEDPAITKCFVVQNRFLLKKSVLICTILSLKILKTLVHQLSFVHRFHFLLYTFMYFSHFLERTFRNKKRTTSLPPSWSILVRVVWTRKPLRSRQGVHVLPPLLASDWLREGLTGHVCSLRTNACLFWSNQERVANFLLRCC